MIDRRLRASGAGAFTREIAELVADLAREARLDEHDTYRLRLAADEITTNIATHGYQGRCGLVEITGGVDEEWVWLRIEDEAPRFDPTGRVPSPGRHEDPLAGPVGGHGLFLALHSLDNFAYEYAAGRNRNVLRLCRSTTRRAGDPVDRARSRTRSRERDSPVPVTGLAEVAGEQD